MARSPTAYRFTVKDYHRMAEAEFVGGVREFWWSTLSPRGLHVTRPGTTSQLGPGESPAPLAFPDLVLEIAAILP